MHFVRSHLSVVQTLCKTYIEVKYLVLHGNIQFKRIGYYKRVVSQNCRPETCDATHYLKVGASVSSRLRCFRRNKRLIVAPPLGRYSVSERFYQVLNPAHPGLNNKVCGGDTRRWIITSQAFYMNATNNNDVLQGLTCNLPYTIRLVRVRLNQEMIEVVFLPRKLNILYKMLDTKSSLLINNLISRLHPTS